MLLKQKYKIKNNLKAIVKNKKSLFSEVLFSTLNSLTPRWWGPRSFCLHTEGQDCHKTWSDTNRSSHHQQHHHCCRVATVPRARSRRRWSGSAAGKHTSVISHRKQTGPAYQNKDETVFRGVNGNKSTTIHFLLPT